MISRALFHRVYWKGNDPLTPPAGGTNRYDCTPKASPPFRVLYLGFDLETCWLEAVIRHSIVRPAGDPIEVPIARMTNRWACQMQLQGEIILAEFADTSLVDLGDTASNLMADSYIRTQRWSELVYAHTLPQVDGLKYRSRFKTSEFCIALFDRGIAKANLSVQHARSINPATSGEIQALMGRHQVVPI
jgi:hypothetical protein